MKPILFSILLAALISCSGSKKSTATTNPLNGTWITTKMTMAGMELPEAAVKNQKLVISDSNYTYIAESVDKGVVKYNGNKMDIYGRDGVNAGKHFTAIYKMENGDLVICYNLTGDSYPESFETSREKPMIFTAVFKKE
ncbi:MAG TPA: TIGR03067 domain-containing protein [Chitinophagaceae bacterium]|nr:TIGR03067 domain-containing protein [Chitinophagaceae bacterium]